ncbi:MAG TPA: SCO family protein, partial [Arachidicoccus soli]|nr:SCO family protein [Arachidicoccus soli]
NKVWVVDFIFSTCQNICSPMTYAMKDINDSLKNLGDKVVFLSFSIDPTHDTPSVLKKYKEAHQISAKNWYFLTGGDQEQINQFAINQFLVFATADKDAPGGFAHSQNFILVDKDRHVRGIYDGLTDKGRNGLIEGVKTLLNKR